MAAYELRRATRDIDIQAADVAADGDDVAHLMAEPGLAAWSATTTTPAPDLLAAMSPIAGIGLARPQTGHKPQTVTNPARSDDELKSAGRGRLHLRAEDLRVEGPEAYDER